MLGTQTWCLFNRSICGRPSPHSWRVSPVEPQTFSFQFWLPAYLRHTSYRLVLFSLTSPIHPPTLQHTERPSSWGTPCRANTGAWRAQRLGKQLLSFPLGAGAETNAGRILLFATELFIVATHGQQCRQLRSMTRRNVVSDKKDEFNNSSRKERIIKTQKPGHKNLL